MFVALFYESEKFHHASFPIAPQLLIRRILQMFLLSLSFFS